MLNEFAAVVAFRIVFQVVYFTNGIPACAHVVHDAMGHVLGPQEPHNVVRVWCGKSSGLFSSGPPAVSDCPLKARGVGI
jgi:hypothetical protein